MSRHRAAERRALQVLLVALAVLVLVACGGRTTRSGLVYRVNPPAATLQYLDLRGEGKARASLRLENHSTVPTTFGRVDLMVHIDGRAVGRIDLDAGVELPPLRGDAIEVEIAIAPEKLAALRSGAREIRYRIEGALFTTAPRARTPIDYDSRLSPVPGRPGEYR